MIDGLTHFNEAGDAQMVDVADKPVTHRTAIAEGWINMRGSTLQRIRQGDNKKGDVLGVARIAGIMAAKKTSDFIPLCHPLNLTHVSVDLLLQPERNAIYCQAQVETDSKTGVEMEALNAVQVALLTVYDMCKAVDRGMVIEKVQLRKKTGGQSGEWDRE